VLRTWQAAFSLGGRQNRLGALSEVSKTIAKSPYLEEILQLLVNYTAQQFDYRVCTLRLLDESSQELVLRATQAPAKAYQKKRAIKLGESYAGKAIVANKPIVVQDVQVAEDYVGHDLAIEQGLRSMICVPLTLLDRPIGVLTCYTAEIREFSADEIKALETLAKQAAVSIEHAKMQVRNTLMQEMHHRVKNNLQQVASLLRLQMRHSTYKTIEEALNDCLNRILAISSVHDLLSRDDLDHVSIRSIAESLVHHQQSSFLLPDRTVRFEVRGSDIHLSMTQATQLALVLNELIQNAIEHGFRKATDGEIHVNIEHVEELDEVSVWVSNSGDPLPDGFDPTVTSNLGLKIVDNLARGLNGRFKMANVLGWTVAEVKFHRATSE
jgi:two-component sensor histidine kinase